MINCGLLSLKFLLTETIILRNSDFYLIKENTGTKFRNNVNFFFNFRRIVNDSLLTYRTDYALGPSPWDPSHRVKRADKVSRMIPISECVSLIILKLRRFLPRNFNLKF